MSNTTDNHLHNALMRQELDALYAIDKEFYGYNTMQRLRADLNESVANTLDGLLMWGVPKDGAIDDRKR